MNWNGAVTLAMFAASVFVWMPAAWAAGSESKGEVTHTVRLDASALYNGFEARKVVLDAGEGVVKLDPNALKYGGDKFGTIVTDPIDLVPHDEASLHIGSAAQVKSVKVRIDHDIPAGSEISLAAATIPQHFSRPEPGDWRGLPTAAGPSLSQKKGILEKLTFPKVKALGTSFGLSKVKGRYVWLQLKLEAKDAEHLPAVKSLTVTSIVEPAPAWKGKARILKFDNQEIVTSPINFGYEPPDQPDIARFRKRYNIDKIVEGAKTDFDRAWRLAKWVNSIPILREGFDVGYNPWDINKIFVETPSGPKIKPHCLGYAITLITALTSINIPARHWCERGFRDCSHEVVEAWCQELGKWVYLDPSLATYYYDLKTKTPLSIMEMHNLWLDTFLKPGEDLNNPGHMSEELQARVKARDHTRIIGHACEGKPYGGEDREYPPWHWGHGYLSTGWLQLTPRNSFHGQPEPIFRRFGHDPYGWDGFPYWVDDKTPLVGRRVTNWVRRQRDVYWTLHQASMHLAQTDKEGVLEVEFGHSQPFFEKFVVAVDGRELADVGSRYQWKLKRGKNSLKVVAVDRYGRKARQATSRWNTCLSVPWHQ